MNISIKTINRFLIWYNKQNKNNDKENNYIRII